MEAKNKVFLHPASLSSAHIKKKERKNTKKREKNIRLLLTANGGRGKEKRERIEGKSRRPGGKGRWGGSGDRGKQR